MTSPHSIIPAALITIVLLSSAICCNAQRGTGANPVTKTSASPFALVAPPPFKQPMFTWTNPAGASNVTVSWGLLRDHWTNGSVNIGTSNSFPYTNPWQYMITVRVNNMESIPALWPSNRIGEIWLTGMGANFIATTNIQKLCGFTNQPPGNMQFWGVKNITTGWE